VPLWFRSSFVRFLYSGVRKAKTSKPTLKSSTHKSCGNRSISVVYQRAIYASRFGKAIALEVEIHADTLKATKGRHDEQGNFAGGRFCDVKDA
jgi:hypothetical protein